MRCFHTKKAIKLQKSKVENLPKLSLLISYVQTKKKFKVQNYAEVDLQIRRGYWRLEVVSIAVKSHAQSQHALAFCDYLSLFEAFLWLSSYILQRQN